jgi:hypothetical protein
LFDILAGRDIIIIELVKSIAQIDDLEFAAHLLTSVNSRRAQFMAIRSDLEVAEHLPTAVDSRRAQFIMALRSDLEVAEHLLTEFDSAQFMAIRSQNHARILELRAQLDALGNQLGEYNEQINA